jgi:biotin transport system substrate-specific component
MENNAGTLSKRKTLHLTLTALFAALIAAGTFIAIPLPFSPVPIVLQNLFALLAGLILGPLHGAAAVGLYLIAGAAGAPVFAGASGGFVHIIGPTGGFLLGYLLSALTAGFIAGPPRGGVKTPLGRIIPAILAGLLVVYVPGVIRLKFALAGPWRQALIVGFVPFIPGDLIKGILAAPIALRLRRAVSDLYG